MIDCLDYGDYDSTRLVDYAEKIGNTGVIRRLGFIDDHYDLDIDVPILDGSIRNFLLLEVDCKKTVHDICSVKPLWCSTL